MKRGDEIHITLERFAFEGKSVARTNGLVLFVHGGVPGDEVLARVTKVKKHFAEARTIDVLSRSSLRTTPRCRYFGTCGGCKWQNVDYTAQLEFKRQHVADALERIGGFHGIAVRPTLGAEETYFYRNKMEFSFGERWLTKEEMLAGKSVVEEAEDDLFALGLHIPNRFDKVLDIEECWLQSELSYRIVNAVREFCRTHSLSTYSTKSHSGYLRNLTIRESRRMNELMVNLVTSDDKPEVMKPLTEKLIGEFPSITTIVNNITQRKSQVAIGDTEVVYYGSGYIREMIGSRVYRISANSFFQTNTEQAERLYDTAKWMAQLRAEDLVFDLYSGIGTIALHIADAVRKVLGIESVEAAVEDARENAAWNNVSNCAFVLGDLKDNLSTNHPLQERPRVMIIDPPRAGVHPKVVTQVASLNPERIVYISCNPATQARDLKMLCEIASYKITDVQPVDMFPHTYHIENIVGLSRPLRS